MDKNGEEEEYDLNSPIKCRQSSLKVVYVLKIYLCCGCDNVVLIIANYVSKII